MKAFKTIFKIESRIALFRHPDSLFFAILLPCLITLIIGLMNENPAEGNCTFIQQSFGALVTISICTTGLMGYPMTVANYREKKILKRFQITPVSPIVLLTAQALGCFLLVIISMLCIYTICVLCFGYTMLGSVVHFIIAYVSVILAIYSIGLLLASISSNIKIAGMLTTIVFFPTLLLSGATIPYEVMPSGIQKLTNFIPLTQGIKMLQGISTGGSLGDYIYQIALMVGIFVVCMALAIRLFKWE